MTTVHTNLRNTRESARQIRVEPTTALGGNITQTNIQKALEQIATGAGIPLSAIQTVTAAGTTVVLPTTQLVIFNKSIASPSAITLPSVLLRVDGLGLEFYDYTGLAGDIILTPFGAQTIMGANSPWTIGSGGLAQTGGSLKLISLISLLGWTAR